MILLEEKEIEQEYDNILSRDPSQWDSLNVGRYLAKATAKKILIELQAIYKDEGMFNKKLGEFIKELRGEI